MLDFESLQKKTPPQYPSIIEQKKSHSFMLNSNMLRNAIKDNKKVH